MRIELDITGSIPLLVDY